MVFLGWLKHAKYGHQLKVREMETVRLYRG